MSSRRRLVVIPQRPSTRREGRENVQSKAPRVHIAARRRGGPGHKWAA
jgi:hypothetical protein